MKAADLQEKSVSELRTELEELLEQQFKMRMSHGAGQLPQNHKLREVRRDVARVRTVINQKDNNGEAR
jgi:large subunit ribosomal protein L29